MDSSQRDLQTDGKPFQISNLFLNFWLNVKTDFFFSKNSEA